MLEAQFRQSRYAHDVKTFTVLPGTTINAWLDKSGFRERMLEVPMVVVLNGVNLLEKDYDIVLKPNDVFEIQQYPRGGETFLLVLEWIYYGVMVAAAVQVLTMPEPKIPEAADVKEGSPTYSLSVKGNRYRPGTKGPILYGTLRIVPDFDSPPFVAYDTNDDQTLHMLFRITQGEAEVDIDSITFEDTPLSNFTGVTTEVLLPGEVPTLFPAGVIASNDISNYEITDSNSPAFVTNDVSTLISKIAVDLTSPSIVKQNKSDGSLSHYAVQVRIEAQEIDDNNIAIGSWTTLGSPTLAGSDRDPIRRTFYYTVTPGRYQVRVRRLTAKDDSQYIADTVVWAGLKGYLYDSENTSNSTRLAITIRASEQIGNRALTDMSLIASRKLPVWDSSLGWLPTQQTNSIAWALADLCRADYGGNRSDLNYDLERLEILDTQLTPEGFEFNGYFDSQGTTIWDALVMVGTAGRITPIDKAGFYTFVRDEIQAQATQAFTMRNIIRGSFRIEHNGVLEETADAVLVTFKDQTNDYRERSILCALPDSPAQNPREITLFGVTNPTRAKELGMFFAAANRYRRRMVTFETGIEGRIPFYGSLIAISHFIIGAEGAKQVSGDIVDFNGVDTLFLSEKVTGQGFSDPHIVMVDLDGKPMPAYPVTITGDYKVVVSGSPDWTQIKLEPNYKRPMFVLGDGQTYITYSKITKVERNGLQVKISGFIEDSQVYSYGDNVVPPPSITLPAPPTAAPVLSELEAHVGGTVANPIVTLSWSTQNADKTEIEFSEDNGLTFVPLGRGFTLENKYTHYPDPGEYVYRLAAVNFFRGPWISINVDTSEVVFNPPLPPTNLALRETFTGPTLKLQWDSGSQRHYIEVVHDSLVKYTETIDGLTWDFDGILAQEFGIGRTFDVRVYAVGENGLTSETPATISVSNPAPAALANITTSLLFGILTINFAMPADVDLAGFRVWGDPVTGFPMDTAHILVASAQETRISIDIGAGSTMRIRIAAFDVWGVDGLNPSSEILAEANTVLEDLVAIDVSSPLVDNLPSIADTIATLSQVDSDLADDIVAETDARIAAIQAESAARQAAVSQAYTDLQSYADTDSAAAINVTNLISTLGGSTANALTYIISQVDSTSATAAAVSTLDAQINDPITGLAVTKATVTYVDQAVADEASARASAVSSLQAQVDSLTTSKASITYVDDAIATEQTARATAITQLESDINGNTASITAVDQTVDGIAAMRQVYIDNNGFISGYKLVSQVVDGSGVVSTMAFNVDAFTIGKTGYGNEIVFGVDVATNRVGINGNVIITGTVEATHLNVASLDAISATMGTLTAGTVKTNAGTSARAELSSDGDYPLWIGSGTKNATNGLLYFNKTTSDLVFKGELNVKSASSGTRLEIDSDEIRSYNSSNVLQYSLSAGTSTFNDGYFRGNIEATSLEVGSAIVASANIQNAAVDTLKIAGNAVTVPVSAFTATETEFFYTGSWQSVQSAVINSGGAPVSINFSFEAKNGQSIGGNPRLGVRVVRDSTTLATLAGIILDDGGANNHYHAFSYSIADTPSTGSHTYYIQVLQDNAITGYDVYVQNRSLILIGTKR